jgi:hypothetical protein
VDKCIGCQYYDRQPGAQADARGIQWGQCRRSAPRLHPVNQKTFMIEGVWPHVRDDDWCGEFRTAPRRIEPRSVETLNTGPLLPVAASAFGSRNGSALQGGPASASVGPLFSGGRAD